MEPNILYMLQFLTPTQNKENYMDRQLWSTCEEQLKYGSADEEGGFFPIGTSHSWHNGIHINKNDEIKPVWGGKIVAYRIASKKTELKDTGADNGIKFFNSSNAGNAFVQLRDKFSWLSSYVDGFYGINPKLNIKKVKDKEKQEQLLQYLGFQVSTGFFLIKHCFTTAKRTDIVFYTMYMHLKSLSEYGYPMDEYQKIDKDTDCFDRSMPFYLENKFMIKKFKEEQLYNPKIGCKERNKNVYLHSGCRIYTQKNLDGNQSFAKELETMNKGKDCLAGADRWHFCSPVDMDTDKKFFLNEEELEPLPGGEIVTVEISERLELFTERKKIIYNVAYYEGKGKSIRINLSKGLEKDGRIYYQIENANMPKFINETGVVRSEPYKFAGYVNKKYLQLIDRKSGAYEVRGNGAEAVPLLSFGYCRINDKALDLTIKTNMSDLKKEIVIKAASAPDAPKNSGLPGQVDQCDTVRLDRFCIETDERIKSSKVKIKTGFKTKTDEAEINNVSLCGCLYSGDHAAATAINNSYIITAQNGDVDEYIPVRYSLIGLEKLYVEERYLKKNLSADKWRIERTLSSPSKDGMTGKVALIVWSSSDKKYVRDIVLDKINFEIKISDEKSFTDACKKGSACTAEISYANPDERTGWADIDPEKEDVQFKTVLKEVQEDSKLEVSTDGMKVMALPEQKSIPVDTNTVLGYSGFSGGGCGAQNDERKLHLELFAESDSFLANKENDEMYIPVIRKNTKTYTAVLPESAGTLIFAAGTVFSAEEIKGSSYKIRLKTVFPECPCSLFSISAGNILTPTEPLELQSGSFTFPSPRLIETGMVQYNDGGIFGLKLDVPRKTFCKWILLDSKCMEYKEDSGTIVITKDASEVKVYEFPPDRYIIAPKGQLEADRRPSAPELSNVICDENDTEYIWLASGKEELCVKASDIEKDGENLYDWKKHFIELNQKDTDKYPYRGCYYKDILELVPGMEDSDKSELEETADASAADYQKRYGEKYLHKMAVSHKSEFARERVADFGKEYSDEDKKDGYAYLRGNMFRKMTAVWGTGTTGLPGGGDDPEFVYLHPVTFINHLYKLQLEFNPYEGEHISISNYKDPETGDDLGTKIFEVKNNPGFYLTDSTGIKTGTVTQWFNERPDSTSDYRHEGVDIAVNHEVCGKIEIRSCISGTVICADKDQQDNHYGKFIIIKAEKMYNGKNKYYLLGHLDRTKYYVKSGQVYPGQIVGYVGNTGHCSSSVCGEITGDANRAFRNQGYGAHLHLQMYLNNETNGTRFLNSVGIAERTADIIIRGQGIHNPFDFSDIYFHDK